MPEVRRLSREEIEDSFDALARLRITVFRDWPYLYDGDEAYERRYLATALGSPGAVVVGAFDGDRLVGAATGGPLSDHFDAFAEPFRQRGWSPDDVFHFGESVLDPAYRGRGVGHAFFDLREAAAAEAGFRHCVFAAVIRPAHHRSRPAQYRPLDDFWRGRGYEPVDGMVSRFSWRDLGDDEESEKPMQVWMRTLDGGRSGGGMRGERP